MLFTVEATMTPVVDDDWTVLRHLLDVVPGALLIEDAAQPAVIFPVEALTPSRAAMFVEGVTKLVGVTIVAGKISPMPDVEAKTVAPTEPTRVETYVQGWIDGVPSITGHLREDGLVEA